MILAVASSWAADYRPVSVELRASYYVADKSGVADAARVGIALAHRRVWTPGPLAFGLAVPFAYGHSESAGYSYRLGVEAQIAHPVPALQLAPYVSAGAHYFVSQGWDEVRLGPMWRVALGLRMFGDRHWEVGVEPLALERIPSGPGPMTPLRSRWGWDLTFLTVGVTW